MTAVAEKHLVLGAIDESVRPLSIRVLGAYAQEALGVRTTLLSVVKPLAAFGHPVMFAENEIRQIARFLDKERVTHLGFYLMTASLKPYRLLVEALREQGYRGVIMAGGVHASLCPEESLVDGADFSVQGPGELPLKMLFESAVPETIPGLVWREGGKVRVNPQSKEQKLDLDTLPFPLFRFGVDRVLLNGKLRPLTWAVHREHAGWHGRYYDLVSSRGCAYRCAYCCNVNGAPVRRAGVDRVIRELKHVRETVPEIGGVNIQDDSFYVGNDEWVKEFCARMKNEVGLPFIVRMIPRYVTPERLELFKSAGLAYVTMGLEGSDRQNKNLYNRPENSKTFIKAAQMALESGLLLSVDLLIHNPYETTADLREIAQTLNALPRPNWWVVSLSLTPFPNTGLYDRCVKDGTLGQFSTNAYDAMLQPSRPGTYRTPRFWLLLNTVVLPRVRQDLGAKLIEAGPDNPSAVAAVEQLNRLMERTKKVTGWFRDHTPLLYRSLFHILNRKSGGMRYAGMEMLE